MAAAAVSAPLRGAVDWPPADAAAADRRTLGFEVSTSENLSVKSTILGSIRVICVRFAVTSVTSPHTAHAHTRARLSV